MEDGAMAGFTSEDIFDISGVRTVGPVKSEDNSFASSDYLRK